MLNSCLHHLFQDYTRFCLLNDSNGVGLKCSRIKKDSTSLWPLKPVSPTLAVRVNVIPVHRSTVPSDGENDTENTLVSEVGLGGLQLLSEKLKNFKSLRGRNQKTMEGAVTPWLSTKGPPVRGEANAFPTRGTALLLGSRYGSALA